MPTNVDRQIARSAELLQRVSSRQLGKRARSAKRRIKRAVQYATISVTAIILVTLGWAILSPIGIGGVLIMFLAIFAALMLSVLLSGERKVRTADLGRVEIMALPAATERWLDAQRRTLPAPAMPILDRISERLEALAPQLQRLNPNESTAHEVHALLSEHLPQLVTDYQSIPRGMQREAYNGRIPDQQLIEGLTVIESEIGEVTGQLARGDLDSLATHTRYLELKYQEMKEIGQQ
jgi:hypothetical protein